MEMVEIRGARLGVEPGQRNVVFESI